MIAARAANAARANCTWRTSKVRDAVADDTAGLKGLIEREKGMPPV